MEPALRLTWRTTAAPRWPRSVALDDHGDPLLVLAPVREPSHQRLDLASETLHADLSSRERLVGAQAPVDGKASLGQAAVARLALGLLLLCREHSQLVHGVQAGDLAVLQTLEHALGSLAQAVEHDGRGRVLLDLVAEATNEVVDLALVGAILITERLEALGVERDRP
jgi:hypothetical protein